MARSTATVFTCTICYELLEETDSLFVQCGHLFHIDCIQQWFNSSGTKTCPYCRAGVGRIFNFYPSTANEKFKVLATEELDSLRKQVNVDYEQNLSIKLKVKELASKLNTSEDSLKKNRIAVDKVVNALFSNRQNRKKEQNIKPEDYKLNEERSRRILSQKEVYLYRAKHLAEVNQLKSEKEKLIIEKANIQSMYHEYKPSTSSKNAESKNILPRQIQLQSSSDGFLSNCRFFIVDELRKEAGATNHLYFDEHRIIEHGGLIGYHYTNMVTHVIGVSQKNFEVLRGLNEHKKCVTDYWLGDVIAKKKIIKPWLVHHFPIPYSEDKLPYKDKQIAIVNFQINEYHKIKSIVEATGAIVINKISRSTFMVVSLKKREGEMIKKAVALKIPVVNLQWINDILLGENIALQHHKRKKYQNFDLRNPYKMNYNKVSHLLEAWDERPKVPSVLMPNKKIVKPTMTNKRMKTCVIQEMLPSGANNGDGNNFSRITSILTIPMATESCSMSSE